MLATDTSASPDPLYTNAPVQLINCQLQNIAPIFINQPPVVVREDKGEELFTMTANSFLNGSADNNRNKDN